MSFAAAVVVVVPEVDPPAHAVGRQLALVPVPDLVLEPALEPRPDVGPTSGSLSSGFGQELNVAQTPVPVGRSGEL